MKKLCSLLIALALLASFAPALADEEIPKISMFGSVGATHGNWDDMYLFRFIEEKFGVDLVITQVPSGNMSEKVNLAFATGDYPDMFLGNLSSANLQRYGEQGMILDLKDYITPGKTPNVYAVMEAFPELRRALMSYDGHMYRVSGLDREMSLYPQARFWVNVQWCENLGVPVPTTLDEYYNYLVAVRDGDADLDGDANNEIPLSGSYLQDNYSVFTQLLNALGCVISLGEAGNYMTVEDGKVIYVPADDRYREALSLMKTYYEEGLMDSEYFTQTEAQLDAKIATGDVGSYMRWANWLDVTEPELYREWDILVPFTSDLNDTPIMPSYDVGLTGMFALTDKCQNIDKALEILDWCFTEEAYLVSVCGWPIGTEGYEGGYEVEDFGDIDGVHYFVPHTTYDTERYANSAEQRVALVSPGWGCLPLSRTLWMNNYPSGDPRATSSPDGELLASLKKVYPFLQVGWPNSVPFTDAERSELSLYGVDILSYMQQMTARFVTGEADLGDFDTYVSGLRDRGLDRYVEIYQTAYDRYIAN